MIAMIAKAWVLLAPMGVETADLRRLVNDAVRNAWKLPLDASRIPSGGQDWTSRRRSAEKARVLSWHPTATAAARIP